MINFMDFIEATQNCQSLSQLQDEFKRFLKKFGIDGFIYSLVRSKRNAEGKIHHGVCHSYPIDWMKYYSEKGYLDHDPTYRKIIKGNGIFRWDELIRSLPVTKTERLVMDQAKEANLKSGMSVSIHGTHGEIFGFGFISSAEQEPLSEVQMRLLYHMANQFHLAYEALTTEDKTVHGITLTERQREILLWAAKGKSRAVIADILNVSEPTIDDHFQAIYKKLGCNERTMAVLKAYQLGLI